MKKKLYRKQNQKAKKQQLRKYQISEDECVPSFGRRPCKSAGRNNKWSHRVGCFPGKKQRSNSQSAQRKRFPLTTNEKHTNLHKSEVSFSIYHVGETFKGWYRSQCGQNTFVGTVEEVEIDGNLGEDNLAKSIKMEDSHTLWQGSKMRTLIPSKYTCETYERCTSVHACVCVCVDTHQEAHCSQRLEARKTGN